ncbi:MAG: universal stress protein [Alphaproteobacteria bacterium]|nr:universal stress protein [Alphaproteobacteria bacterium]
MFKRIVLAYDGSKHAKRAFDVAVELAVKFGAALDIVQVVTRAHAAEAVAAFARSENIENPDAIKFAKCAAHNLAPVATQAKVKGVKTIDTAVLRGDAAGRAMSYAKANGADLIVLGRRGLS